MIHNLHFKSISETIRDRHMVTTDH